MTTTTTSPTPESTTKPATDDPHIAAFCDPNSPEIFRSVAYPTEVWTPDPMDVESIHGEARDVFDRLLNAATSDDRNVGKMLLLLGQSGSGKTHLMRSLRTRLHSRGDGYFGYMQMTSLAGNYSRYVLQKLIDSLDKPYYNTPSRPDQTTGLMRLSTLVAESPQVDAGQIDRLREEELALGEPAKIALQLADQIANDPKLNDCNPDLITALLLLQSSQNAVRKRAIKYLRGERLSEHDRIHLGGLTPVDQEEDAIEMIIRLGRLAWATDRDAIVICVDQLEDIWHTTANGHDPGDRFRTAATTLNHIVAEVPNAIVVIACLDDFFTSVREHLTKPILDRIEKESPVPSTLQANRSEVEARQLAEVHLAYLYDHVDGMELPLRPLHPLPDDLFAKASGLSTRDLLASFRQYRDQCIAKGEVGIDSVAPFVAPVIPPSIPKQSSDHLESLWNDLREDESNTPPDDDESLTELLDWAIDFVDEELARGHSFHSDHNDCDLQIRGRTEGHPDAVILGRVCNRSPRGGALTKRLKDLLVAADEQESDSIPALIRSTDYKPTSGSSLIAKLLAQLFKRGGRKVVVSDSDWRAMAAMRKFRSQHRDDPQFGDWLRQSRPLARLKSLRDLLALDDLDEPTVVKLQDPGSSESQKNVAASDGSAKTNTSQKPAPGDPKKSDGKAIEPVAPPLGKLRVGRARNRANEEVLIDVEYLKRHTGILGSNGSGKTTAALNLIEQLLRQDIPVLLVDRKGDLAAYAAEGAFDQKLADPVLAERQSDLRNWCDVAIYTPGQSEGRAIALPIAPEGMASMKSTDRLMVANQAATSLGVMLGYRETGRDATKIAVLVQAIELLGSQADSQITLDSLIKFIAERDDALLSAIGMIKPNVIDGLLENLQTMQITKKLLFTPDAEPLSAERLFGLNRADAGNKRKTRLSIVNLKFLGDRQSNLFWVSQLLLELSRWMSKSPSDKLQGVVMFDEADCYLPATSKPPTKEPMENLLKRARAAGLGVMLATQSPGDLDYKCRDNVNTWLLGKISESNAIGKMQSLLDDCRRDVRSELPKQSIGEFFLVSDGEVTAVQSDRSVVEANQLPESEILRLAARSREG